MRGTVDAYAFNDKQIGITPADAGNSMSDARGARDRADHPRGCGEQLFHPLYLVLHAGSPPRMRGTVQDL